MCCDVCISRLPDIKLRHEIQPSSDARNTAEKIAAKYMDEAKTVYTLSHITEIILELMKYVRAVTLRNLKDFLATDNLLRLGVSPTNLDYNAMLFQDWYGDHAHDVFHINNYHLPLAVSKTRVLPVSSEQMSRYTARHLQLDAGYYSPCQIFAEAILLGILSIPTKVDEDLLKIISFVNGQVVNYGIRSRLDISYCQYYYNTGEPVTCCGCNTLMQYMRQITQSAVVHFDHQRIMQRQ
jgi:hypothetical protein